jgi:putative CocE/NonD family hydrolase
MQGGTKPVFLRNQVAYYVMGAERWRYAQTLEAITARHDAYFLDSASNANDALSAGSLSVVPGTGCPDTYTYDPRDVCGPEIEAEAQTSGASLVDQSVTLALRGKALVYHTAPFGRDIELSGCFKLCAWISIDCPDTDLYVSVYEVDLHGLSIRLSTDAIRARYREGLRTPRLIDTPAPLRYDFDRFTFFSREIKRGHRLRLVIAPMGRLIESTFAQKNYNGGGVVAEESVKDAKPVTVRVFHERAYPSALHVPIGQPE